VLPRPVPQGWDEAELREAMSSFSVDGSAPGELSPYVDDAFWRFLHPWGLVQGEQGPAPGLGGARFKVWRRPGGPAVETAPRGPPATKPACAGCGRAALVLPFS